jgi:hypothetical protein
MLVNVVMRAVWLVPDGAGGSPAGGCIMPPGTLPVPKTRVCWENIQAVAAAIDMLRDRSIGWRIFVATIHKKYCCWRCGMFHEFFKQLALSFLQLQNKHTGPAAKPDTTTPKGFSATEKNRILDGVG